MFYTHNNATLLKVIANDDESLADILNSLHLPDQQV